MPFPLYLIIYKLTNLIQIIIHFQVQTRASAMNQVINQDKAHILIGGALFTIAYFLDSLLKNEARKNWHIKDKVEKLAKESPKWPYYDELKKQQNKDKKVEVALQRIKPSNISNETLSIRVRQQPLYIQKQLTFQNITGGTFSFYHKGQPVTAEINDMTVLSSILTEKKQEVQMFGHMKPVVKRVEYNFRKNIHMAIVGALSYDIATKKFKIQPSIMGYNFAEIIDHYDSLYAIATIPRIFTFLLGSLGVYFLWQPAKKIINNLLAYLPWRKKELSNQLSERQFFKNKVQFRTNSEHVFECKKCRKNPTEVAYKCGHLSLCQGCHNENKQRKGGVLVCPVCKKTSAYSMKIYFS